jgi:hypothetical protein
MAGMKEWAYARKSDLFDLIIYLIYSRNYCAMMGGLRK